MNDHQPAFTGQLACLPCGARARDRKRAHCPLPLRAPLIEPCVLTATTLTPLMCGQHRIQLTSFMTRRNTPG